MAIFHYPNSEVWWYDFRFNGRRYRESTKQKSPTVAREAERARRMQLLQSYNGIAPRLKSISVREAVEDHLAKKKGAVSDSTLRIMNGDFKHVLPVLGKMNIFEVTAQHLKDYQRLRLSQGASPRTVNMEVGSLRSVLVRHGCWSNTKRDFRMLENSETPGIALDRVQERTLLAACKKSRSLSLFLRCLLTLCTGLRTCEVKALHWWAIDFAARVLIVAKSKTSAGKSRRIPLNNRLLRALKEWTKRFPDRQQDHFVIPYERYGGTGNRFTLGKLKAYGTDPTRQFGSWKTAWRKVKEDTGIICRFHDLRHTACTRMLEAGIPLAVVSAIMGWSAATTVLMTKRYGHIGQKSFSDAVEALDDSSGPRTLRRKQAI